jgi:hypothetical protein
MSVEVPGLQLDQDGAFQRREWQVQRIAWWVVLVLLVLATLGLFGNGPVSHRTVQADEVTVTVQRFARSTGPQTLLVDVGPRHVREGRAHVLVSREFLAAVDIESITPTPAEVVTGGDHLSFRFDVSGTSRLSASFSLRAQEIGVVSAQIALADGTSVRFRQLVYP